MSRIEKIIRGRPTMEGAGVKLRRIFGYHQVPQMDPFLLLDHFGSSDPDDYLKGFPWHPHRGIETVTYMIEGEVEHGDSLGNGGVIRSGDLQWMTAGSGIIHQEMPRKYEGTMRGFQLWVNLPAEKKMMDPRYTEVKSSDIPVVNNEGHTVRVISGEFGDMRGPVRDLIVPVEYLDVNMDPGGSFRRDTIKGRKTFAYVFEGEVTFSDTPILEGNCVILGKGGVEALSGKGGRFIFVSGEPLNEQVAWGGPIVMNTAKELRKAFWELDTGEFIKSGKDVSANPGFYVPG